MASIRGASAQDGSEIGARRGNFGVARCCPKRCSLDHMPRTCRASRFVLLGLFVATTALSVSCRCRDATNQKKHNTPASGIVTGSDVASAPVASAPVIASAPIITSARPNTESGALTPLRAAAPVESVMTTVGDSNTTLLVPIGITVARPLLAILMPLTATPRADCESLGTTVRTNHFVLCYPVEPSPASASDTSRQNRVEAGLLKRVDATLSKYPNYIAPKQLALVGVGLEASSVAPIVRRSPEHFTRVGLLDGGFEAWTNVDSARFVQAGGKALLAVNSDERRRPQAMRVTATIKALGVRVRLEPQVLARESEAATVNGSATKDSATKDSVPTHELLNWLMTVE